MKIDVANTIIYCRNWSESVAFYRDELKFEISFTNEWFVEFEKPEFKKDSNYSGI